MKYLYKIFSMPLMAFMLLVFAAAIGIATFVEDIHGTPAAKAVIYDTTWFEAIMVYLSISLLLNVFKHRLFERKKLPVFLFHISFIVIMIGAALTRYVGIDGMMHIRVGKTSNYIQTTDQYLRINFENATEKASFEELVRISEISEKNLNTRIKFDEQVYRVKSVNYQKGVSPVFTASESGKAYLDMMISAYNLPKNILLAAGETVLINGKTIGFETNQPTDLQISIKNGKLVFRANQEVIKENMFNGANETLNPGIEQSFDLLQLYQAFNIRMVARAFYPSAEISFQPAPADARNQADVLEVSLENDQHQFTTYFPYPEASHISKVFPFGNHQVDVSFGPVYYYLPFYVKLDNFVVNRYPGSNSPSSYDSFVSILNKDKEKLFDFHIYMNHVLHYKGWRFFQSSYDDDEQGSVLSVTYDEAGIVVTYIGYFLLFLSMIVSLFWKGTSFRFYLSKVYARKQEFQWILLVLFLLPLQAFSQAEAEPRSQSQPVVSDTIQEKAAENNPTVIFNEAEQKVKREAIFLKLSKILTLDRGGRIKPMNTLFYEISRKISGKNHLDGIPAHLAIPEMITFPEKWITKEIISYDKKALAELFNDGRKQLSLSELISISENGRRNYRLSEYVETAYKLSPADRSLFDNEIIKLDEKVNILLMLFGYDFFTVFPDPLQPTKEWYNPSSDISHLSGVDSLFIKSTFTLFFDALYHHQYEYADLILNGIAKYQQRVASDILPSESKVTLEITYERFNFFSKLAVTYALVALLAIILIALIMFTQWKTLKGVLTGMHYLLWLGALIQTIALGIRWYISGHAPFSNGYEAMLYISLIGLLIGLVLSYRNPILIFVTAIFAAAPLFVAHLNLMSPELTNLVPVLKSYWLTIHVATITTSYAFFGFIAFISLLNLILMAFFKPHTNRFNGIIDEFTTLNQILLIIGLYLITIGCFLGGIWANESWGTYWSWDPKETWCLVAILVYGFIAHIKHIPSLRSRYAFNLANLLAFSTILMTYFGVNYFLGGMHSYGKGDAFDLSTSTWISVVAIAITILVAYFKESRVQAKS